MKCKFNGQEVTESSVVMTFGSSYCNSPLKLIRMKAHDKIQFQEEPEFTAPQDGFYKYVPHLTYKWEFIQSLPIPTLGYEEG